MDTLSLITAYCNDKELPVVPSPSIIQDLREIDLYEWEGLLKDEVKARYPVHYEKWRGDNAAEFQLVSGHYPVRELWTRARSVWQEVFGDLRAGQARGQDCTVLMMGHNAMNQALLCAFMGYDESHFRRFEVPQKLRRPRTIPLSIPNGPRRAMLCLVIDSVAQVPNCGVLELRCALPAATPAAPPAAAAQALDAPPAAASATAEDARGEEAMPWRAGRRRWRRLHPSGSEWVIVEPPAAPAATVQRDRVGAASAGSGSTDDGGM